jgi:2-oxoglutarate dehydrogenase E2 component (dihydrolipoamide succinyltransferase)
MATDVIMPQMGESIFEGTITKWLKKAGDKVERDEPLFEISTDKVDAEIPAPAAGVLREIKVGEGQTVPIQTVVAVIDGDGAATAPGASGAKSPAASSGAPAPAPPKAEPQSDGSPTRSSSASSPSAPSPIPSGSPLKEKDRARSEESPGSKGPIEPVPAKSAEGPKPAPAVGRLEPAERDEKVRSSPLVRKLAGEHEIDLTRIPGTGAGGRVSKKDILGAIDAQGDAQTSGAPAPAAPGRPAPSPMPAASAASGGVAHAQFESAVPRERIYFGNYEVQPMSVMRQRIAEHMLVSKRVSAHVYSVEEVDMTRIAGIRAKGKEEFEKASGTKLTFMPFFIRAVVEGLRAFPTVNASIDGTNVVYHRECNIGIAVALDWGLIVPVIKSAEEKNFLGIARTMNNLAERARTKKLKPEEVQESTFAITNPGSFGGLMGLPIINQPNVAILGIGTIQKRAVVINDAIAIRSMVYITMSYDHRVVDGAVSHQFLGRVKSILENWNEAVL